MNFVWLKKTWLFLFCILPIWAHGVNMDSLYTELATASGTHKVDILVELADFELPKKGVELGETAVQLGEQLGYTKGVKEAWIALMNNHINLSDFEEAERFALQLLSADQAEKNTLGEIDAYYRLGAVYSYAGRAKETLNTFYTGLLLATKVADKELIARGETDLATFFSHYLEDYDKALELGLRSYNFYKEKNDSDMLATISYTLGKNYYYQGDYETAKKFLKECIFYTTQVDNPVNLRFFYGAMADVLFDEKAYDEAIAYLNKSMELSIEMEDSIEMAINKFSFAKIAFETNKEAEGVVLTKEGIAVLEPYEMYEMIELGYQLLYDYYEKEEDLENALFYSNKLAELLENKDMIGTSSKVADLELKVAAEKYEAQLKVTNAKNALQKTLLWGALVLVLVGLFFYRKKQLQKEKVNQQALSKVTTQQQEQALAVEKLEAEKNQELQNKKRLEEQLTLQQQALTTNSLLLTKKEELLDNVHKDLKEIRHKAEAPVKNKLITVSNLLERHKNNQHNWEAFRLQFEQIHPDFIKKLLAHTPKLNNNDIRFASYLKLNLSTTEIAEIMSVAPGSIHKAKYRLKKKLTLEKGQDLHQFLTQL